MLFEWDPRKASSNKRKHGLSFEEASTVFGDPAAETFPDPDHLDDEQRWVTIGYSVANRLVTVVHVARDKRMRIISAWRSTRAERWKYEEDRS
jgi:hypothetical protein